ncbi:MAG: Rha family transcriptional regulator [Clostridiales bacterium]|nr:Rha family transcriptional regulator [Clostridiales bacterium]
MLVEIKGKKNEEILITTSRMIAEVFEKRHADVLRDIENLGCSDKFRERNFAFSEYKVKGNNKTYHEYIITRDGFTLLVMGYTGEKAMLFKEKYIHAFNEMEKELKRLYEERKQWEIERAKGITIRHVLTDTIKMKVAESPHKKFAYPNYTKLIYKTLFGKGFKELQEELGIKAKESVRDYLTSEQLREVESLEMLISGLIGVGMGYDEIKDFISGRYVKQIAG